MSGLYHIPDLQSLNELELLCVFVYVERNIEFIKANKEGTNRREIELKHEGANRNEDCFYFACISPAKVTSSLFLLGAVPGLASCQLSGEPNDSFDPIRIGAKSTLCSLRTCTRQLTTYPPLPRSSVADTACQPTMPCMCQVSAGAMAKRFAESVLIQHTSKYTIAIQLRSLITDYQPYKVKKDH